MASEGRDIQSESLAKRVVSVLTVGPLGKAEIAGAQKRDGRALTQ